MPDDIIITVDGKQLKDELYLDLLEVVVDTNVFMPAMFSITLQDALDTQTDKLKYTDTDTPFKVGAEVKIEMETDELPDEARAVKATLIIGDITAIEPIFEARGRPTLTVRGYDRAHLLSRGKKTRTYGDANPTGSGITDEQIINTIVQETAGITGKQIDTSGISRLKYHYILQNNQTDLEFLWERARAVGYQVYVEDKKLFFQKADFHRGQSSDKPGKYVWGNNLSSFEPRLTLMHQIDQAIVKGWNPKDKTAIEGKGSSDSSKTLPQIGLRDKGGALAKKVFKDPAEGVVVKHPLVTIDQARTMADALFAQAGAEFIQADGYCRQGDPRLIAGRQIEIEGVGERFSGKYYVTEARHTYDEGRYQVRFSVSGRTPNTLSYLLNEKNGSQDKGLIQGVVTAKVTSLEDPEALGRVQVMFPWLPKYKNADLSSNWARLANPMGGAERGFFYLPEVDDEVLVAFEHGDPNFPYIVGTLWNHKDKPPVGTADILASDKKSVNQRILRSRSGHLIILDDTDSKEQIIIQDKTEKNSIVINSKDNSMTIKAEGDLTIEAGGKFILKSKGDMSFESKAKGNIKTTSDFSVQATGKGSIKSQTNLTLEGSIKSELKGGTSVSVSSSAQAELKGGAMVTVQGALVKIN